MSPRLLYLTSRFPSAPGEAFLTAEVRALTALGAELHIVPCVRHLGPVPVGRWSAELGEVHRIDPTAAWAGALRHPWQSVRMLRMTVPPAMQERTKVAARGVIRGSLAVALATRFAGRIDHVHAHWADTPATVAMATAGLLGVPWSFTAHRGDVVMGNDLQRKVRSASFVHCISERTRELLLARLPGSADDVGATIAVRHLGVNVPSFADQIGGTPCGTYDGRSLPEYPSGLATGAPELVCPGQLKPVKGHRYLIEAIAVLRDRGIDGRLVICGEGDLLRELQAQTESLGLGDRVEFTGDVAQTELFRRYRSGRVRCVVLPSIDLGDDEHEGIPVALIEAMAHGIAVVSTRTGGIPELITDDSVGLLVAPQDPQALADALGRLLGDPGESARIGASARTRVRESWTATRSAEILLDAIKEAA